MRLLVFLQGQQATDQLGFHTSFQALQIDGTLTDYAAVPWVGGVSQLGWEGFSAEALRIAKCFEPDAVYFQFFHAPLWQGLEEFVQHLKKIPSKPIIAVSSGDAFAWTRWMKRSFPLGFLALARAADVTFLTAMGKCADFLIRAGVRNMVLLPLGACQERFHPAQIAPVNYNPSFDVVFLGRNSTCKDPRSILFYYGIRRRHVVRVLEKRYGRRLGLFGPDWSGYPSWQGTIPYDQQLIACQRGRVIFGGVPGIFQDYYASDRPFIQTLSGVPLVDWNVPRIDRLFRNGDHLHLVDNDKSLLRKIDQLLEQDVATALKDCALTAQYAHTKFSQSALTDFLVDTIKNFVHARRCLKTAPLPTIPYFLPEIDIALESQYAIRNWIG